MAKTKAAKETSTPVIVSLVFFVLTTIGLGVFAYVLYSDQEAKDKAVADSKKELQNVRTGEAEAQMIAVVHRVLTGFGEADDLEKFSQIKEGDKAYQEYKKLIDAYKAKLPPAVKAAAAKDPAAKADVIATDDLMLSDPEVDDKKQLRPPARTVMDLSVYAALNKNAAVKVAAAERESYASNLKLMADAAKSYQDAKKVFADKAVELPATFKAHMDKLSKDLEDRTAKYRQDVAESRAVNDKINGEKEELGNDKRRLQAQLTESSATIARMIQRREVDPLQFDEPQGKITRRSEGIVEIDLGQNARVQPGLTFSILPYDYPEKGRRSQMKVVREVDQRGNIKTREEFIPKATIEVIEVLGPNLSRARITTEYDSIRDGVLTGDLLYNAVWRKGQSDHIALIGIFDTNGDGSDDIEAVVNDLNKMGIPVDAYFDLKTQKWVGRVTERTRYVVEGSIPSIGANDPYRDAKVKMNGAMKAAKDDALAKGSSTQVVNFRDFFGKMGYRAKVDVSEERVNQAATRYLSGTAEVMPEKEKN